MSCTFYVYYATTHKKQTDTLYSNRENLSKVTAAYRIDDNIFYQYSKSKLKLH